LALDAIAMLRTIRHCWLTWATTAFALILAGVGFAAELKSLLG
jgi:hypothetical protein